MAFSIREEIKKLGAARKGSLFENFYKDKIDPDVEFVRHLPNAADIKLSSGELIDLKLHANKIYPKGDIPYFWLDYLLDQNNGNVSRIYKIDNLKKVTLIHEINNSDFEEYYSTVWKNRKKLKRKLNKENNDESVDKNKHDLKAVDVLAEDYLNEIYNGKNRFIKTLVKTVNGGSAGPAIYYHKLIDKYERTILLVRDESLMCIPQFWVFEHNLSIDELKPILEKVEKRLEIKYRFIDNNFPSKWKFIFVPPLTIKDPRPEIEKYNKSEFSRSSNDTR